MNRSQPVAIVALLVLVFSSRLAAQQTTARCAELPVVDREVADFLRGVPGGLGLAVRIDGELVYSKGYGDANAAGDPVTSESLFRIASISKLFTRSAVERLVPNTSARVFGPGGILNGRFPLQGICSGLPAAQACGASVPLALDPDCLLSQISVAHLIFHRGGWNRFTAPNPFGAGSFDPTVFHSSDIGGGTEATPDEIVTYMLSQPFQFEPGDCYSYSNFGYTVLGRVIEEVSRQDYETYVQNAILRPLGLTRVKLGKDELSPGEVDYFTPLTPIPMGPMDSHGAWIASAEDLVRYLDSTPSWQHDGLLWGTQTSLQTVTVGGRRVSVAVLLNSSVKDGTVFHRWTADMGRLVAGESNLGSTLVRGECPSDGPLISAVLRSGRPNGTTLMRETWEDFVEEWQTLGANGQRLIDIEIDVDDAGVQRFDGVWESGSDGYALYVGMNLEGLTTEWQSLLDGTLRLVDVETYTWNGVRYYAGVWRETLGGAYDQKFEAALTRTEFTDKFYELKDAGYRLIDLETYRESNGARRYLGVWDEIPPGGNTGWGLFYQLSSEQLIENIGRWNEQGLHVLDIESYNLANGERRFDVVWEGGSSGERVLFARNEAVLQALLVAQDLAGFRPINIDRVYDTKPFLRGDANIDGSVDVSDAVSVFAHLFTGGVDLNCLEAANANNDWTVNIADGIMILRRLFQGGSALASPGRSCGLDVEDPGSRGALSCDVYDACN